MAQETELERLVVRLTGDASSYQRMLTDAQSSSKKAAAEVERAGKRMEAVQKRLQAVGASIRGLGKKFSLMVTAPVTMMGAMAGRKATQFETAILRLNSLVGMTTEQVEEAKKQILEMAPAVGKGPLELVKAYEAITSGGLRGAKAMEALEIAAKGSALGMGETVVVGRTAALAMAAYGKENLNAVQATNTLRAAAEAGNAEAAQFAPVMGRVLPLAKSLGLEFGEVAGAIAFMTRRTGEASSAATGLAGMMSKLRGMGLDKKALAALGKDGTEESGMAGLKEIQDIIKNQGLVAGLKEVEKRATEAGLAMDMFFKDREAGSAAVLMTDAYGELSEIIDKTINSAGGIEEKFAGVAQTMGFQFAVQAARIESILIELGNFVAPVMGKMLDFGEMAMGVWQRLSKPIQKVIATMAAVAAAVGPVLVVTGMIVASLGTLIGGVSAIGPLILSLISPTTIIMGLIAGIVVALIPWKAIWDQIMTLWKRGQALWQGFSANMEHNLKELKILALEVWVRAQDVALQVWSVIVDVVSWAVDSIMDLLGVTGDNITKVWDGVKDKSKTTWESVTGGVKKFVEFGLGFMTNFRENMGIVWKWIKKSWKAVWDHSGEVLKIALEFYGTITGVAIETLIRLWTVWAGLMSKLWKAAGEAMYKAFRDNFDKISEYAIKWAIPLVGVIRAALEGGDIEAASDTLRDKMKKLGEQALKDFDTGFSSEELLTDVGKVLAEQKEKAAKVVNKSLKDLDAIGIKPPSMEDFNTDHTPLSLSRLLVNQPEEGEALGQELGEDVANGVKAELDKMPSPIEFQAIVNVKYEANTASLVGTAESLARRAEFEAGKGIRKEQEKAVSEYIPIGRRGGRFDFFGGGGGLRGVGTSTRGMTGGGGEGYNEWGANRLNSRMSEGFAKEVGGEEYTNWATDRLNARFDENFAPPRDRVQEFQDVGGGKTVGTSEYDKWLESRTKEDKAAESQQEILTALKELVLLQRASNLTEIFGGAIVAKESSLQ